MGKTWRKSAVRITDVVTSAEASAAQIDILIPGTAPTEATDDFAYNINITRSRADFTGKAIHFYNPNSGTVVVRTNSTDYVLTAGDAITVTGTYL